MRNIFISRKYASALAAVALAFFIAATATTVSGGEKPSKKRALKPDAKVLLMIDEKNLGSIPTSEVESMGARMLKEAGLKVLDRDMARANQKAAQQNLKIAGDARGAVALGNQYGAEMVVIGEAVAKPSARRVAGSNLRTYQAVVTLRALRTSDSAVLASASKDASILALEDIRGSAQALRKASKAAFEALLKSGIIEQASGDDGKKSLTVTVGGLDELWKLRAIREKFRSMDKVMGGVSQKNYTTGLATFEIIALIPTEELAEAVVVDAPKGLKFKVLHIGSSRLELKVNDAK